MSQATSGQGCRPSRVWIEQTLKERFKYVYFPKTQPKHSEFKNDWNKPVEDRGAKYARCIFIASNHEIINDKLTTTLPKVYEKWN